MDVAIAMPTDVAVGMGKAYRTLYAYRKQKRSVTLDAARGLSGYLRKRAKAMLKAADALDEAITNREERNG